jgi:hypothetical protein
MKSAPRPMYTCGIQHIACNCRLQPLAVAPVVLDTKYQPASHHYKKEELNGDSDDITLRYVACSAQQGVGTPLGAHERLIGRYQ